MHRFYHHALKCAAACLLFSTAAFAGSHNPAEFPLRVHVFQIQAASHYYHQQLESVDGDGRADLFENGEPRGFEFSFHCDQRFRASVGFETYMARWRKPGRELEVLLPVMGKPGSSDACDLKVLMKDVAYTRRNGSLTEEPIAEFKAWMAKHEYDPEHGKNQPVNLQAPAAKQ